MDAEVFYRPVVRHIRAIQAVVHLGSKEDERERRDRAMDPDSSQPKDNGSQCFLTLPTFSS